MMRPALMGLVQLRRRKHSVGFTGVTAVEQSTKNGSRIGGALSFNSHRRAARNRR